MEELSKTGQPIRIAVDAMGGDHAPAEIVKGAVQAAKELGVEIILVGIRAEIETELNKYNISDVSVRLVEASQVIRDGEQPAKAFLRKPDSSVAVATRLVKEGKADASMSAGSTGAAMVAALQYLGTLPGIERPVAGGVLLGLAPNTIVMDLGANAGCHPYHLVHFAIIGSVYARSFLGIENPTVGLLNVGSEEGKGTDEVKETYSLLKKSGLNFIGNVEGMDIPAGKANVIICDGFVGNILIKLCEGLGQSIKQWLSQELKDKLAAADSEKITGKLYSFLSPAVVEGGGPLLGVNGVAAIAHGNSLAPQVVGTIKRTKQAIENNFIATLRTELEKR